MQKEKGKKEGNMERKKEKEKKGKSTEHRER